MNYDAVNARLRTAPPAELTEWLSNRTPEATTALSDASKADPQAVAASMAALQANNFFGKFRALNIPCLLVYGERIRPSPFPHEETSLSTMTIRFNLEGSGHFPMIDETDQFNRLLTDFLALEFGRKPA